MLPRDLDWLGQLPASVAFVDVETTGFSPATERIVSFAAVRLETRELAAGRFVFDFTHLIFNPGKRCHPKATAVHGYDDALLQKQRPFAVYAPLLANFLEAADQIVAHNAEFDLGFINKEIGLAGCSPLSRPVFCTMNGYQAVGSGSSAALASIASALGLDRAGRLHGALEDAWLAMIVYLWLHGCPYRTPFPAHRADMGLVNLRS